MKYRFISWNVNGIRAVQKKGFLEWLSKEQPDILALQETKAHLDQLDESLRHVPGYHVFFSSAERRGYSGVAVYTKEEPLCVARGIYDEENDPEGRALVLEYPRFFFLNIYFPNGKMSRERLQFKLDYYQDFLGLVTQLKKKKKTIIVCGDVNTAHTEIDLARPKENSMVSGFLPQERMWLDTFIERGLTDTFRVFHKEPGRYTWWDFKSRARERNVGWRIDYFFIDTPSRDHLKDAFILHEVSGSDHCPVGIEVQF
ncbi:MAG: exodeoxyribonuclease III [Candidatus Omnitrophica bacterium]|nr:exodeoxyribonuclease III [Candidatus Omnitrophota bacterium]